MHIILSSFKFSDGSGQMSHKNILLVDDEIDICEVIAFQLEDAGFKVKYTTKTVEALEIMKGEDVDLILSDLRMADGGGMLLLENKQHAKNANMKILIMSGYAEGMGEEAQKKGAYRILNKPISIENLKIAIAEALD